jgi:hypothetical protein
MKKLLASTIVLSVMSMNSFALANPFSGALTVGKVGTSTLITFSGAPAKSTFKVLAVKGDSVRLNSNTTGILKNGTDVSCLQVTGVDAYECKLLINSKGDSEKLTSYKMTASKKSEGFATGGGLNDYINLTLNGLAANDIAKNLKDAKTSSKRTGSLLTTSKSGLAIRCNTSAEVAISSVCQLSIQSNGNVDSNFLR